MDKFYSIEHNTVVKIILESFQRKENLMIVILIKKFTPTKKKREKKTNLKEHEI